MPELDRRLRLPDGRTLCYNTYGTPGGSPVLYFHGTPGARIEFDVMAGDGLARRLGLRVIAPDRPGMGGSSFQPGRAIGDWPADVAALADSLGIERFAVVGYSGGVPYAVATAVTLPERVTTATLVASVGPHDMPGVVAAMDRQSVAFLEMSRTRPRIAGLITRQMGLMARFTPGFFARQMRRSLPTPDLAFLADQARLRGLCAEVRESMRGGARGDVLDTALMVAPWDVRFGEVRVPTLIWQGEQDREAPALVARHAAASIPGATAAYFPEDGHLSIWLHHAEAMLAPLGAVGAVSSARPDPAAAGRRG
jgi:pimeloyl-ACP methyl ester carboxylesterase